MNSYKTINAICKKVLTLTDEDFAEIEKIAYEQVAYMHPLKHATQSKFNRLGAYNLKLVKSLRELQAIFNEGADIIEEHVKTDRF